MSNPSNYKRYQLSQLGIKESTIKPSDVDRDAFPGIDPEEWEKGAGEEHDEHGMPVKKAVHTAADHLGAPDQGHYYSGMEKAKSQGMLRDMMSPTARGTPVIGLAVRGSSTGGFPSGIDQTGIPSNTPTGRLGGYEPIPTAKDNSEVINKTPSNPTINSSNPISSEGSPTEADPHPHQVQQSKGAPPQDITGASTDSDATLTITQTSSAPEEAEETEKSVDIDVNQEEEGKEPNDMDGEESMEDEDKAKAGLNERVKGKKSTCQKCKGDGRYTTTLKDTSGKNPDSMGNTHIVPCDAPACHNGQVDHDEYYKQWELTEGKHKKGCQCGFCKNKGSFGKKKKETDENAEPEKAPDDDDKKGKKLIVDKDKDKEEKVEEKYSPPFERMRGLANLGSRRLSKNGLWEGIGSSEPFTTKWKMDKEKAGMVKVDECKSCGPNCTCEKLGECKSCGCGKPNTTHDKKIATEKLNEVHQALIKKAQSGKMNAKETQIYQLLKEVIQKRNLKK